MKKYCYGIALIMLLGILTGCSKKPVLELKQDVFTVELGQAISEDKYDYLNTDKITDEVKSKLDEAAILTVDIPEESMYTQDDKTYPLPGEYHGTISYQKETVNFTVEVKDSIAPIISGLETIELVAGTEFNYSDYYLASDLNKLEEIQYDTSAIDINTEGTYTLKISVKDAAGNVGEKEVLVVIKAISDSQESTSEVVTGEDGTQSYITTVTDKPVYVELEAPSYQVPSGGNANPTNQTPPASQDSEDTASNNSNAANNTPSEPDRTESACTPTVWNSGLIFDSLDEAINYAEKYADEHYKEITGYGTLTTCRKTTISWTYR